MNTTAAFADTLPARFSALHAPSTPSGGWVDALSRWLDAWRSRQTLDELDDHLLKDIGLTRAEARREASKFFWQA
jgi:uncharacterized protein YjiS (DUF1127 family)